MSTFSVALKGGSPWGFRIQGGREFEEALKIAKINPNSKAYNEGIKVGDYVYAINGQRTDGLNHADAQALIKNATDKLFLDLRRGEETSTTNGPHNGEVFSTTKTVHVNPGGRRSAPQKPVSPRMDSYKFSQSASPTSQKWSPYGMNDHGASPFGAGPKYSAPINISVSSKPSEGRAYPAGRSDMARSKPSASSSMWSATKASSGPISMPKPAPKPVPRQAPMSVSNYEKPQSSRQGSSATKGSKGTPSKGMDLFLRQQEKLVQLGADVKEVDMNLARTPEQVPVRRQSFPQEPATETSRPETQNRNGELPYFSQSYPAHQTPQFHQQRQIGPRAFVPNIGPDRRPEYPPPQERPQHHPQQPYQQPFYQPPQQLPQQPPQQLPQQPPQQLPHQLPHQLPQQPPQQPPYQPTSNTPQQISQQSHHPHPQQQPHHPDPDQNQFSQSYGQQFSHPFIQPYSVPSGQPFPQPPPYSKHREMSQPYPLSQDPRQLPGGPTQAPAPGQHIAYQPNNHGYNVHRQQQQHHLQQQQEHQQPRQQQYQSPQSHPQSPAAPYFTPSRSVSVDEGARIIPITVQRTQPQTESKRSRSTSEGEPLGFGAPPVGGSSFSWQSGTADQIGPNYGPGSYATLPVKKSPRVQEEPSGTKTLDNSSFVPGSYSTLPAKKPARPADELFPASRDMESFPASRNMESFPASRDMQSVPASRDMESSNYGVGSYATLPAKKSSWKKDERTDARDADGHFDFNLYSTLPTIKPLRSHKKVEFLQRDLPRGLSTSDRNLAGHKTEQPKFGGEFIEPKTNQNSFTQRKPQPPERKYIGSEFKPNSEPKSQMDQPDFAQPLWTNTDLSTTTVSPAGLDNEPRSPPSSNVTSSSSRDTIISKDTLIPIEVVHEETGGQKNSQGAPSDQPGISQDPGPGPSPDIGLPSSKDESFSSPASLPVSTSHSERPPPDTQSGSLHQRLGSSTSSPKTGVWTPGLQPSKFRPEITPPKRSEPQKSDASLKDIAPIWTPGGSPARVRKEFKPVKLDTSKPIPPKPKQLPNPPSSTTSEPASFSWKPLEERTKPELDVRVASDIGIPPSSAPSSSITTDSKPLTSIADTTLMNGNIDSSVLNESRDDLKLPPTQSPYVTLLQKSRELENLDEKLLDNPIMVDSEGQIPRGALYLGKKETVDGNQVHTDTYYAQPTKEETTTTKTVEHRPKKYEGIGPLDQEGVPLAFRKNIDEENQHAWYRQMYKTLHRTEKEKEDGIQGINKLIDSIFEDADDNTYRPTYQFPDDISDTRSEEDINPYKPSYEFPSKMKDDSGYRSEPEGRYKDMYRPRHRSESGKKEPRRHYYWSPAHAKASIEVYRNQPRSIMDYEPGFSSIAFREAKSSNVHNPPIEKPGQFSNYSLGRKRQTSVPDITNGDDVWDKDDPYKRVQKGGEIPYKGLQKPAPEKPKKKPESSEPTESISSRSYENSQLSPNHHLQPSETTNQSLKPYSPSNVPSPPARNNKSSIIPKVKLRTPRSNLSAVEQLGLKSPPSTKVNQNGAFRHQTTDVKRAQPVSEKDRRRREEDEAYRKRRLEQLYEEERQRKIRQEAADMEARKHSDFFTPSQKSPIPLDRYNEDQPTGLSPVPASSVPPERRRGFQIQGKGKVLYNFTAQNPRELSLRKNDIVYLIRQIDKNWLEGERHGRVGIFPVSYVEVVTSIEAAKMAAMQSEGQGQAKYNFTAHTSVELSLRKGEFVVLLRRIDENWYEGKIGMRQGIFPVAYIEVIREPSTPLVTPAPSVITTPMTGTPEMLSPVGYDAAPTPPPQPSPSAFAQRSPTLSYGYRQPSPGGSRSQSSQLSPMLDHEYRSLPRSMQQSPTIGRKPASPSSTIPRTGYGTQSQFDRSPLTNHDFTPKSKVADDDLAIKRYRALYAYRPQNEDELELNEGDEVYVSEKCDDGWYVGTSIRTGQFGTFPGNYVQQI